jgi:hypothetical protein
MICRQQTEFGVGHGIAVHATTADGDTERAFEMRTEILPR